MGPGRSHASVARHVTDCATRPDVRHRSTILDNSRSLLNHTETPEDAFNV